MTDSDINSCEADLQTAIDASEADYMINYHAKNALDTIMTRLRELEEENKELKRQVLDSKDTSLGGE